MIFLGPEWRRVRAAESADLCKGDERKALRRAADDAGFQIDGHAAAHGASWTDVFVWGIPLRFAGSWRVVMAVVRPSLAGCGVSGILF